MVPEHISIQEALERLESDEWVRGSELTKSVTEELKRILDENNLTIERELWPEFLQYREENLAFITEDLETAYIKESPTPYQIHS